MAKQPQPTFGTTQQWSRTFFNDEIKFNDKPRYIKFKHYGLDYSDFDRNGQPSIYHIMKLAVHVRLVGMFGDCDGNGKNMTRLMELIDETGCTIFVAATDFVMSRDMYNPTLPRTVLDAKVALGNVGNGSITFVIELFLQGGCKPIMRHIKKFVLVNPSTRKPIQIPEWFKEVTKGKGELENVNFRIDKMERPAKTFYRWTEVTWSDTDMNAHTNYASYVRLAVEALHKCLFLQNKYSARNKDSSKESAVVIPDTDFDYTRRTWGGDVSVLKGLTEMDVAKGVHRVRVIYLKECVEGDLVETHLWEDLDNSKKVNCSIEGSNGQTLCQISLEYFPHMAQL